MKYFATVTLLGIIIGAFVSPQVMHFSTAQAADQKEDVYKQLDLFGDVFDQIREEYVESVDNEELIEAAINGMLTSLDPHSSYLDAKDFEAMKVQTRGEFGGLGIEVTQEDSFIKVIAPIDDTPAARAGIEAGDFITQVDGESISGLTLDEAVRKMRGPAGTDIIITVVREGVPDPFEVTITRDIIKLTAIRSKIIGDTVVLRITTFNDQTYKELEKQLNERLDEIGGIDNVNGFIIDLRNNPGGLLTQAINVSDAFLDKGEIVSTRGRDNDDSERVNAKKGDLTQGKPIVVLVNEGSASASEIVAGALQDHKRAIIVGTRTFGKGSVQTIVPAGEGGAMRLTTARYYTPSGRSIQALGVMPDILVDQPRRSADEQNDEQAPPRSRPSEAELRGRLKNDSMTEEELELLEAERIEAEVTTQLRLEDYQLAYAVDILRGLTVTNKRP